MREGLIHGNTVYYNFSFRFLAFFGKYLEIIIISFWYYSITKETNIIKFITDKTNIIDPCNKFYNLLCNA